MIYKYHLQIPKPSLNKIASMKIIWLATNFGLKESKELVDSGDPILMEDIIHTSSNVFDNLSAINRVIDNAGISCRFWFSIEGSMEAEDNKVS